MSAEATRLEAIRAHLLTGREEAASWIDPPEMARAFVAMYDEATRLLDAGEFEQLSGAMAVLRAATVAIGPSAFGAGLRAGS